LAGDYTRYGFRVPAVVVSPFAKKNYVSHVVHDHTSILSLVEHKWNLPALTNRDGAADNLLDCLDLDRPPAFLTPPQLPRPKNTTGAPICTPSQPGPIPNPNPGTG
jgi:phospholipase C